MLNSVQIGGKDLYTDFGCILAHVEIGAPTVRTKYINVPLRNGKLDLTEALTGDVRYENRKIKIDVKYEGKNLLQVVSDIQNYLHGQSLDIHLDEDAGYLYLGRLAFYSYDVANYGGKIHITGECDPFKYSVQSSDEDWLWDTFDFEEGYINEFSNVVVDGSTTITIIGDKGLTYATVTSTAQMDVTFGTKTVRIGAGDTTLYDFELKEGDNVLTFTGNGTITIKYRGGRL